MLPLTLINISAYIGIIAGGIAIVKLFYRKFVAAISLIVVIFTLYELWIAGEHDLLFLTGDAGKVFGDIVNILSIWEFFLPFFISRIKRKEFNQTNDQNTLLQSGKLRLSKSPKQCASRTASSNYTERCTKPPSPDSRYCWQHSTNRQPTTSDTTCTSCTASSNYTERCTKPSRQDSRYCWQHQN